MLLKKQKYYPVSRLHALPDNHNYVDDGCDISPSCLNCKFSQCKYDDKKNEIIDRNKRINLKINEGFSIREISNMFNLSTRTVRRIIDTGLNKKNTNYKLIDTKNIAKVIIKPRKPFPPINA